MKIFNLAQDQALKGLILNWLHEDVGNGDVTSHTTIPAEHMSTGIIHCKENGVLAGLPVAELVFRVVDPTVKWFSHVQDGALVDKGTVIAEVEGPSRSILTGERLALNLLQRLSGIATKTHAFVQKVEDLNVRIVDTRKTTPGHRQLEKYAVRVGGGHNHRFGLYDAVMIKDNHIKAAGGITEAVRSAREGIPHTMKIEVETENMAQVEEALLAGADIIMLDNMPTERMKEAVRRIKSGAAHVIVEASGGITVERVREIAETGVDVISVGGITHSVQALDISLDLFSKKGIPV